jgi:hypothetical protein
MSNEELFLIKHKTVDNTYIHYDAETYEYFVGFGKEGSGVFTKEMSQDFLNKTGLKKDWISESTGVKTEDTNK